MSRAAPICFITGVGPGTGLAIARKFSSEGHRLALLARSVDRLAEFAEEFDDPLVIPCDVADGKALESALDELLRHGVPKVVVNNAVGGSFGDFLEIDPNDLSRNFDVNVMAILQIARHLLPEMVKAGGGSFLATGNTSAYRGKSNFAGFAPTKAAQRILLESIARRMGPEGIHCAYIAIDAVIDLDWTRKMAPDKPDDFFCQPTDIAEEVFRISQQSKSAWSFDSVIRPFGEEW